MKYVDLKRELKELAPECLREELEHSAASEETSRVGIDRLMKEYPPIDKIPFTVLTKASTKLKLGQRAVDIVTDGAITVSIALTADNIPGALKDELKKLDVTEVEGAVINVMERQSSYSEAWDITDSLADEYPAFEVVGTLSREHADNRFVSANQSNLYICGALLPGLVLKQMIDQTELASIPTQQY